MPLAEIGVALAAGADELKKRVGPLALWQYGVIGIGAFSVYRYVNRGKTVAAASNVGAANSPLTGQPISYDPNSLSAIASIQSQLTSIQSSLGMQANGQPVNGASGTAGVTPSYDLATLAFNLGQAQALPQFASVSGLLYSWQQRILAMLDGTAPVDNAFLTSVVSALAKNGIKADTYIAPTPQPGGLNLPTSPNTSAVPANFLGTPLQPGQAIVNGQLVSNNTPVIPVAPVLPITQPSNGFPLSSGVGGYYTVQPGQTLIMIAAQVLGDGNLWPALYQLNQNQIGLNPNNLTPGMVLQLPLGSAQVSNSNAYTGVPGGPVSATATVTRGASPATTNNDTSTTAGFVAQYGNPGNTIPQSNVGIPGVYAGSGAPVNSGVNQQQLNDALAGGAFQN